MTAVRKFACVVAALLVVALTTMPFVGAATDERATQFKTHMFGRDEVPPVGGPGVGWSTWQVEGDEMRYRVIVSRLGSDVVAIHLHQGQVDRNGPVVVPLDISNVSRLEGSRAFVYEGVITPDDFLADLEGRGMAALIGAIEHDSIYVNVHTSKVPSGAVRGQLTPFTPSQTDPRAMTTAPRGTTKTTTTAPTITVPTTATTTTRGTLPPPAPDGECVGLGKPKFDLDNGTNAELTISVRQATGGTLIERRIAANEASVLFLPPGTYLVEADVDLDRVIGFSGTWVADVGCTYSYVFFIS